MTRRANDINFRIASRLRNRLNRLIKGITKVGSSVSDLGCSIEELKIYLEGKFQDGMNWKNYGKNGWELDHIIPLSRFNLENREEFLKACHYSNIQPLWRLDNRRKGNSIVYPLTIFTNARPCASIGVYQ